MFVSFLEAGYSYRDEMIVRLQCTLDERKLYDLSRSLNFLRKLQCSVTFPPQLLSLFEVQTKTYQLRSVNEERWLLMNFREAQKVLLANARQCYCGIEYLDSILRRMQKNTSRHVNRITWYVNQKVFLSFQTRISATSQYEMYLRGHFNGLCASRIIIQQTYHQFLPYYALICSSVPRKQVIFELLYSRFFE